MSILRICGLIATLAFAVTAMAYPTLSGPTGTAVLPSAMTAAGVTVAADYQSLEGDGSIIPIRALIGIGSNVELGATFMVFDDVWFEDVEMDDPWSVNAKWAFANFLGGKAAIGGQYMQLDGSMYDYMNYDLSRQINGFERIEIEAEILQAYFAWTRVFELGDVQKLGLTWGVNWTDMSVTASQYGDSMDVIDEDEFRYFAAISLMLTDMLCIAAEYQTRERDLGDAEAISAVSARIQLNSSLTAQLGVTNAFGPIGMDNHNFFAGLSFAFGGGVSD